MPLSTEDTLQIQALYSTYNYRIDLTGDAAGVAELFVADGIFDHGQIGRYEGRAAITGLMQRSVAEQEGGFQHYNGNLLLEGDGRRATGTAYVMTVDARGEQPVVLRTSVYRDSLVKTEEGWRFESRRVGYPATEFRQ